MKVTDNRELTHVRFSELKPGSVFNACGDPCIKTVDNTAVCLTDGNYVSRFPNDLVEPLKAEVIIG